MRHISCKDLEARDKHKGCKALESFHRTYSLYASIIRLLLLHSFGVISILIALSVAELLHFTTTKLHYRRTLQPKYLFRVFCPAVEGYNSNQRGSDRLCEGLQLYSFVCIEHNVTFLFLCDT